MLKFDSKIRALPLQLIKTDKGVVLRRGNLQMNFDGQQAFEMMNALLGPPLAGPVRIRSLVDGFGETARPRVTELLAELYDRRLVVLQEDYPEEGADPSAAAEQVFYWDLGTDGPSLKQQLNSIPLVMVGLNELSMQVLQALQQSGLQQVQLVDAPLLHNPALTERLGLDWPSEVLGVPVLTEEQWLASDPADNTLVCVASDLGNTGEIRRFNQIAVDNRLHFLPLVLDRLVASLGPLVVPGRTPCYECMRARENAAADDVDALRVTQNSEPGDGASIGLHPSVVGLAAHTAVLAYLQHVCGTRFWTGSVIEIDSLGARTESRALLRMPRCQVCSSLFSTASPSIDRLPFGGFQGTRY